MASKSKVVSIREKVSQGDQLSDFEINHKIDDVFEMLMNTLQLEITKQEDLKPDLGSLQMVKTFSQ